MQRQLIVKATVTAAGALVVTVLLFPGAGHLPIGAAVKL